MINYILHGNVMVIYLIVWLTRNISWYKISYFSDSYTNNKKKVKVELDLFNFAIKSDLKIPTALDTSDYTKTAGTGTLKVADVQLDIDE